MGSSSGSFNIWKYGKDPNDVKNLRSATDLASASSSQHTACDRCHDKKIKCSGEKSGCETCVAHQLRCEYTRNNSRGRKPRGHHSKKDDGKSSSSRHSRSHKSHDHSRGSSSQTPRYPASASAAGTTDIPGHEDPFEQVDWSTFQQSDAFDMTSLTTAAPSYPNTVSYVSSSAIPTSSPGYSGSSYSQYYPPGTSYTYDDQAYYDEDDYAQYSYPPGQYPSGGSGFRGS